MNSALIVVSAKACEAKEALTSAAPSNVLCKDVIGDFNILAPATVERVFNHRAATTWAVHPESFEVVDPAEANGHSTDAAFETAAVICGVKLLGTVVRYSLTSASVPLKMDALNRPSIGPLPIGSRIRIRLRASDVREI